MAFARAIVLLTPSLVGLSVLAPAACTEGDESALPDVTAALRARFPEHASRILEGEAFVPTEVGFTTGFTTRTVAVDLPHNATDPVRFRSAGGRSIVVRERGLSGEATVAAGAVTYRCTGGTSFWTAVPHGVKEWIHLDPGVARSGEVAAVWDIEGAGLRQRDRAVDLLSEDGEVVLVVTADAAFASDGRPRGVYITAREHQIELFVEANGEALLIDPQWVQTGSLSVGRARHTASLLPNGKVLIAGGAATNENELYDPVGGSFSAVAPMAYRRLDHTATTLTNNKVLMAGGGLGSLYPVVTELYDPTTGVFSSAGSISTARQYHTASLLSNGKVLLAGGIPPLTTGTALASAELYNATTGAFAATGSLAAPRTNHTATVLPGGKVLIAGGRTLSGGTLATTATTELYNPTTGTFSAGPPMSAPRAYHTATLLANGTVLVTAGTDTAPYATAEIYNPVTNVWTPTGTLAYARYQHTATLLGSGKVLVVGGAGTVPPLPSTTSELWDPATGIWSWAGTTMQQHVLGTATVLGNGSVLIVGGGTQAAEVYSAQTPHGGLCTLSSECKSGVCADGVCCSTPCSACHACSVEKGAQIDGICFPLSGTLCDDGDPCTLNDQCSGGNCLPGAPKACPLPDECHLFGVCDPNTGLCTNPKNDGASCNSGDKCLQGGVCLGGVCSGATPITCVPSDSCHFAGTCNPTTGNCFHPLKSDGSACNDSNPCTQTDTCHAGVCQGSNLIACPKPGPCEASNTCDPSTGQCNVTDQPDGTVCSDGNVCTDNDTCHGGVCIGGMPVTCPAVNECHELGTCNPTTGACISPLKPDGTACAGGICQSGVCLESGTGGSGGSTTGGSGGSTTGGSGGSITGVGGATSASSGHGGQTGTTSTEPGSASGCGCEGAGRGEERQGIVLAWLLWLVFGNRRRGNEADQRKRKGQGAERGTPQRAAIIR